MIQTIKQNPIRFLFPAICVFFSVFFAFHLIIGGKGLLQLQDILQKNNELLQIKRNLTIQHQNLLNKVNALSSKDLDLDLLIEHSRKTFGIAHSSDTIIFD